MLKKSCSLLLIIVALALSFAFVQTAAAAVLTWRLNGVTFGSSGKVTGWFKWDTTRQVCTSWALTVTFPPPELEGSYYFGDQYKLTDGNSTFSGNAFQLKFTSTAGSCSPGDTGHAFVSLNPPFGSGFPNSLSPGPFDASGQVNNVLVLSGSSVCLVWGYNILAGSYSGSYPPAAPVQPLLD